MPTQSVITIGNFDGVHMGHRAILAAARRIGQGRGLPVKAVTFDPHPATVLRPGSEPARLTTAKEKVDALRAAGADEVVVLGPTPEMLSLDPRAFLGQMVEQHGPVAVVEGVDFHFGKDRRGSIETLRELGPGMGFEVHVVDPIEAVLMDQWCVTVSSSLVRWLLAHGRVADAARCLGRAYTLTGQVVSGDQRGRANGVPTANLDPLSLVGRVIPGEGVYGGYARLACGAVHTAAISVGRQATFDKGNRVIEAHLLDYQGDLYGQTVAVGFARWVRDQSVFPGPDALRTQLRRDIELTRRWGAAGLLGTQPHVADRSVVA